MNVNTLDDQLSALITQWRARPFQWGVTDCCQFAREAAYTLHGVVTESPVYINEREALRAVVALGGFTGILQSAGFVERPLISARRGDFVLIRHAVGLFKSGLALVTGQYAHTTTALGLLAVPRSRWVACWGVK